MAYEPKLGDITIFKNNKTKENQPDYSGSGIDLQGNEIKIALWVKDSGKGKFFSGKIQLKDNNKSENDLPL